MIQYSAELQPDAGDRRSTSLSILNTTARVSTASVLDKSATTTGMDVSSPDPCPGDSLQRAAVKVLRTADPFMKAERGDLAVALWRSGGIREVSFDVGSARDGVRKEDEFDLVPDEPARDSKIKSVAPKDMPKRGKGGSLHSRQALIHSLVHIENCAVDLSWDIIARFCVSDPMPCEFYDDFVRVAEEEGKHFRMLEQRLRGMGSSYGAFPVHQGLWETAHATSASLLARLALEHCVHEARGLDVVPLTISRFRAGGDKESADLLETVVYPEEITHCKAGVKWFTFLALQEAQGQGRRGGLGTEPASASVAVSSNHIPLGQGTCEQAEPVGLEAREGEMATPRDEVEMGTESDRERLGSLTLGEGDCHQMQVEQNGVPPCSSRVLLDGEGSPGLLDWDEILKSRSLPCVVERFHEMVRTHFRGSLKPPFNVEARQKAGFVEEWYLPLAKTDSGSAS